MSYSRRNTSAWQVEISAPAQFIPVEGQFDDAVEDCSMTVEDDNVNKRNLEALFHSRRDNNKADVSSGDGNEQIFDDDDEEEDDPDSDIDEDFQFYGEKSTGPNTQKQNDGISSEELLKKFVSRIKIEKYEGVEELPSGAGNKIISSSKKITANRNKVKDKQDRATVEQVMDPRTRMILYKLLSGEKIQSIDGCISTGKEANVYHATGPEDKAYAIKIFKTSILTFKARDKYVTGEFRFRQGYCKKNPRKMVKLWAEKEFRNLLRIHSSGSVLVPQPRLLKSHVLVMDFIGSQGWPCPLLKDVKFENIEFDDHQHETENKEEEESSSKQHDNNTSNPLQVLLQKLYRDSLVILYRLYKHCKLVHADFSEFNLILKDNKDLYVIDVSQSVEHDHPRSFDFLKSDIKNVQEFFGKMMLVGDFKEIFDFITSPNVEDSNYIEKLDDILSRSKKWENLDSTTEVFRQSYIPRKMDDVVHFERDYDKAKKGEAELIYTSVMGMKPDFSGPIAEDSTTPTLNKIKIIDNNSSSASKENEPSDEEDSGSEDSDTLSGGGSDSENTSGSKFSNAARPRTETSEEKRERKKQVKQERAEKRATKIKKHVKKRQEKLAHHNSKK